jgi:hypothetical protein
MDTRDLSHSREEQHQRHHFLFEGCSSEDIPDTLRQASWLEQEISPETLDEVL